jgi:uncharacterized protein YegL
MPKLTLVALLLGLLMGPSRAKAYSPSEPIGDAAKVLIVLDRSGSMDDRSHGSRPISRARQAVVMVASMMEAQDLLGLVVFNDKAGVTVPLGLNTAAEVEDKARVMRAKGGTSFNAGLRKAALTIEEAGATGVQIIFISDGDDRRSISTRWTETLQQMDVRVHTIATGRDANRRKLCRLADQFDGLCVATEHVGLKATMAQMVDEARGRRVVADIMDVIRPEESQAFKLELSGEGESVQLMGTWGKGDLAFVASSPSGVEYSTEAPTEQGYTAGSAQDAFRVLRFPAEAGEWVFRVEYRSGGVDGLAYRVSVAVQRDGHPRLLPLTDTHAPGEQVLFTLADCSESTEIVLYLGEEAVQTVTPEAIVGGRCSTVLNAPGVAGLFPVAINTADGPRMWATLSTGTQRTIIAQRDTWRPETQVWNQSSGWSTPQVLAATAGLMALGLLFLGVLLAGYLIFIRKTEDDIKLPPAEE